MKKTRESNGIFRRAMISGTVGGLAVAITASLAGKRENGSYFAPLNATSHIVWGDKAAHQDKPSLKYTLTGFLLNHASAIFWALFYEKGFGGHRHTTAHDRTQRRIATDEDTAEQDSPARPVLRAAVVTAGAYITDYYLVPERFTPGFEKRLSGKSLFAIYTALAVGLAACDLVSAARAAPAKPK